jgi:hypothetical protein
MESGLAEPKTFSLCFLVQTMPSFSDDDGTLPGARLAMTVSESG